MKTLNKLSIPLIQGGMGVGISLGGLAGAVAKEGGMGVISTACIGFREPDFYENPSEAGRRALKKEKLNSEARILILSESGKMEGEKKGTHL